jgi:hypothetical protein
MARADRVLYGACLQAAATMRTALSLGRDPGTGQTHVLSVDGGVTADTNGEVGTEDLCDLADAIYVEAEKRLEARANFYDEPGMVRALTTDSVAPPPPPPVDPEAEAGSPPTKREAA